MYILLNKWVVRLFLIPVNILVVKPQMIFVCLVVHYYITITTTANVSKTQLQQPQMAASSLMFDWSIWFPGYQIFFSNETKSLDLTNIFSLPRFVTLALITKWIHNIMQSLAARVKIDIRAKMPCHRCSITCTQF